jgi:predicted phage-related endonuclease
MEITSNALLDVLEQLKQSIDEADWMKAGLLDEQIKSNLEQAIHHAQDDTEKQALVGLLNHVQIVYTLLLENTEEAKKRISLELKKITLDKKASDLYQKASRYQ